MNYLSWPIVRRMKSAGERVRRACTPVLGRAQKVAWKRMSWFRRRAVKRLRWLQPVRRIVLRWPRPVRFGLLAAILLLTTILLGIYERHQMYTLSNAEMKLVHGTTVDKKFITDQGGAVSYNREDDTNSHTAKTVTLAASQLDATGKAPYTAELSKKSGAITFSDAGQQRQFKLIPQFATGSGVYTDGRLLYPQSSLEKHVYTFRTNGIKEDILLARAPAKEVSYAWKLQLGSDLTARLMANGDVGIYSANPNLFGNVQVSDAKSQQLIDKARSAGQKDNLAFVIPAPYIIDGNGDKDYKGASFKLSGSLLTLTAKNLKNRQYPLSIDPSVVVTTTADFESNYSDNGGIDYGVADQIGRRPMTSGAVGSISTSYFNTPRVNTATVAYNGYLYVIGGARDSLDDPTDTCTNGSSSGNCNDIQRMPINADGSLGSISTSYFNTPRVNTATVAYNGYLYVIGGRQSNTDTACVNTGVASQYCNDIQRMPINADGSLGTISTSYFNTPRTGLAAVANSGFLYIVGGSHGTSDTSCVNTGISTDSCNDIQRMPINADGSLGSISTSYFNTPRGNLAVAVYGGYLYVMGGIKSTTDTACTNGTAAQYCNDIQRMPINADGSLGSISTSYFNLERSQFTAIASNGYLYIIGGVQPNTDTTCVNTGVANIYCNDIQRMPINSDGSLGTITTSYFNTPRGGLGAAAAKGYLYVLGGSHLSADTACTNGTANLDCNDIQIAPLGMSVPDTSTTGYFNVPRYDMASVAYNGFLYIMGGLKYNSTTNCLNTGVASTFCNDIQSMPINADGSLGTISTSYFNTPRYGLSAVAYNGYLYVIGGSQATANTACVNTGVATSLCNDIQRMPINSDGSLGTISTSYFNTPRSDLAAVTYNGYLYVVGGQHLTSDTSCVNTGVANIYCNDIQSMPINADGSLGTISTSYFNTPRSGLAAVAYKSYLYLTGGQHNTTDTACVNTGVSDVYCNDIQRMPINSDGSLGTIGTSYFNTPRQGHAAVAYNGFLYLIGGRHTATDTACVNTGVANRYCNDIERMTINSDGSLGTISTSYFNTPRWQPASVVNAGNIYIIAGNKNTSSTACVNTTANGYCNDIQWVQVGAGNDGPGSISTSYFNTPRNGGALVAFNGFLYVIGGSKTKSDTTCLNTGVADSNCNDIQRMPINSDGSLGTISTSYFNTPRTSLAAVAYNGYLYIAGGYHSTSDTACTNGAVTYYCNDIQRMPINSDGSLGTISTSYFNTPREYEPVVAYNGVLYLIGGQQTNADTACVNTGVANTYCNDIQRMPINADGSLGIISTSYFNTPRTALAAVAYNGNLYIAGGSHSASDTACVNTGVNNQDCNDIERMPINADGSLGTISTSYFNTPRTSLAAVAYNSYLYIGGGSHPTTDTACVNTGSSNNYCNDIQRMPINADGSLGIISTSYFNTPRTSVSTVTYNGYLYLTGGQHAASNTACTNGTATLYCNDIQGMLLQSPMYQASYEKVIDFGRAVNTSSIIYNGANICGGVTLQYKVAGTDGVMGAMTTISGVLGGVATTASQTSVRYMWVKVTLDDSSCGTRAVITDITVNYIAPPDAPILISPAAGANGTSTTPTFTLRTTDDPTYVRYKLDICSVADCSVIVRTVDQTASQTGWTGQDAQAGTAYNVSLTLTSSTIASHTYQAPALTAGTQYWWRAYAIDPADSNTWSQASAIQSFITQAPPSAPVLISPAAGATTGSTLPVFQLRSSDANSDWLQYKLDICSVADCSVIVRTVDQTASQTGWTGQDASSNTAYASSGVVSGSTIASHTYQAPALTAGTQYWWRAYAIDPGGSNTWSAASSIQSFSTPITLVDLRAGTTILGGTQFGGN